MNFDNITNKLRYIKYNKIVAYYTEKYALTILNK